MADFTDPEVFFEYLSPFWTRMFKDADAIRGLMHANAQQLCQLYLNWLEAIDMLAIKTAPPFHKEKFFPVIVRRSKFAIGPDHLTYGSGTAYGPQPDGGVYRPGDVFVYGGLERLSGLYYIGMPAGVVTLGPFLYNRLTQPSVVMVRDSDFLVIDNIVAFREDPFENPLIPKRVVAGENDTQDEEIILWASEAQIDHQRLYRNYGFAFPARRKSSEAYRLILETFFRIYADGPTPLGVDMVVAALAGLPVTKEPVEIVEAITAFNGKAMVVTDGGCYTLPAGVGVRAEIVIGTKLEAGSPLADATRVYEGCDGSNWWNSIPVLTFGKEYFALPISGLGFLNQVVKVVPKSIVDDGGFDATFELIGLPKDIATFWESSSRQGAKLGRRFGTAMWEEYGKTLDGVADPSQDLYINPLQFMADKLMGRSVVVVKIDLSKIADQAFLIQNLQILHDTCPVFSGLIILLEQSVEDTYELEPEGNVPVTELDPSEVDFMDQLAGKADKFTGATAGYWNDVDANGEPLTKIPEALSTARCPDIITDTADFNDPDFYEVGMPIAQEILTTSTQPVCKP